MNCLPWISPITLVVCISLILIGIAGGIAGFMVAPLDAWLWLLIIFLMFAGITNGMLAWAAAFRVAQARWAPVIARAGQSALAFTPVLALTLIALIAGVKNYAPWSNHPIPGRTHWLNIPFFSVRELVIQLGFWALCFLFVRWSLTADARRSQGDQIAEREHYRLNAMAVAVVFAYVIAASLLAYDFVMSLSPEWTSTMFPAYFFTTNAYAGMGVLIIYCAVIRKHVEKYLQPQQFKDMGNLMLGFSLLNAGFFFAQYLTIWYENLPEETRFIIVRYLYGYWPYMAWPSVVFGFLAPFVVLQSRFIKERARFISVASGIALFGYGLERYILIVPSIEPAKLVLYVSAKMMIFAFIGLFILATRWFLSRYPIVSSADEALSEMEESEAMSL